MTIEQTEQIVDNLATKLEPVCMEVLNQGAGFVATEALYLVIINIVFFMVCFIGIWLASNIRDTDIQEVTIAVLLVGAFLSAANFLLTFSHNMATIQYPMGYLLLKILK